MNSLTRVVLVLLALNPVKLALKQLQFSFLQSTNESSTNCLCVHYSIHIGQAPLYLTTTKLTGSQLILLHVTGNEIKTESDGLPEIAHDRTV